MNNNTINNTIENTINKIDSYKNTHPNLVNLWTSYLELKKMNYTFFQTQTGLLVDFNENEYTCILDYLENGYKDYTNQNIMLIFIYKLSLLDDELFHNII